MARLIEIDPNPSSRQLHWFGFLLGAFCALAGGMVRWRLDAPGTAAVIWAIGGVLSVLYWIVPAWRRSIYLGWLYAVFPVGWAVSHCLLVIVYFLVITPMGLVKRLVKGDPLGRTPDPSALSYWTPRETKPQAQRYFRQY
ncbi:MAG: hypothetical protein F4Y80_06115 [Caldilineaceae bacterium SB0665_bin_21]|nr:hypothetical protein [Caldilineaceae bacterium SB0665_bin_21]MYA04603.1 hypothetical protein [Caldilineaceae bacterium SB0664_bin_22]MYC61228.1 hypothetical protein [Caldilineaceae bacterium SB0661_bin_34]